MPHRLAGLIVAEGVALDQLTGRLTAFNILDNVFAANLPALLPRIHVIGFYELGDAPESVFVRAELIDPSGAAVATPIVLNVEFKARTTGRPPVSHTTVHTFWGTQFRTEGDHRVTLSHAPTTDGPWEPVAHRTFCVMKTPHPLAGSVVAAPVKSES